MIKHFFFDLDRTLWDFEKNSHSTLNELFIFFNLCELGIEKSEDFISKYKIHNERLWILYRDNKITKEQLRSERFLLTLKDYGINDPVLANKIGLRYIAQSPIKKNLFPYTNEILTYLKSKYTLHIITNGFEEVQHLKLKHSNINHYFNTITTSEQVGCKKPNKKIFLHALKKANANANESIMIGDDIEADILGAEAVGMQAIYFNPKKILKNQNNVNEINCLTQLKELF